LVGAISETEGMTSNPKLRRINRIKTICSSLAIEQNTFEIYEKNGAVKPIFVGRLIKST